MDVEYFNEVEAPISMLRSDLALLMTAWLLSSMLVLCVFARLLYSFRKRKSRLLPVTDDVIVAAVGLVALASMFTMSTTVTDAATSGRAPPTAQRSDAHVKSCASTILFVSALSLSKMPLILWLKRLNLPRIYGAWAVTIGCTILAYMLSTTIGVIFQCKLAKPWNTRMGQFETLTFWITMIAIDTTLDLSLTVLSVIAVMNLSIQQRTKSWVAFVLLLRTVLIAPSLIRLVYLQQPTTNGYNPMLESLPYAIATQCQITIATMLSCTPALPYLANLAKYPSTGTPVMLKKHWSGSSFGSDIANEYFASEPAPLSKQPLSAIQASMATPTSSRQGSVVSLLSPAGGKFAKAQIPLRPPPPSENQRPDMSMFTRRPAVMKPPPVTLLRGRCEGRPSDGILKQDPDVEPSRKSKHVKFDV